MVDVSAGVTLLQVRHLDAPLPAVALTVGLDIEVDEEWSLGRVLLIEDVKT